jgi:transcriptional regulator with XRE-family HTH domain
MKQKPTLTEVVRQAVKNSGQSQYAIGKRCGFSHRIVGHFLSGRNIRLDTAGAILEALGISVELKKDGSSVGK